MGTWATTPAAAGTCFARKIEAAQPPARPALRLPPLPPPPPCAKAIRRKVGCFTHGTDDWINNEHDPEIRLVS